MEWSLVTAAPINGGSSIISYNLQWDNGSNEAQWIDLLGISPVYTSNSNIVTSVLSGASYKFRIRARNVFGWGDFSPITVIKAAKVPA